MTKSKALQDAMAVVKENLVEQLGLDPIVRPPWKREGWINGSLAFRRHGGLVVLLSASLESDGKPWLHVSASRRDRIPNYSEMADVKRVFVGRDRMAIQVMPPEGEHFNLHPYCLHLWAPIGHLPLPDFRFAGGGV